MVVVNDQQLLQSGGHQTSFSNFTEAKSICKLLNSVLYMFGMLLCAITDGYPCVQYIFCYYRSSLVQCKLIILVSETRLP
jgi:hypothetical protein